MVHRHVPSFISSLRSIRVKKPQLKPGMLQTTQSYASGGGATSQPPEHTIDPNEGIDEDGFMTQRPSSQPTHLPSRPRPTPPPAASAAQHHAAAAASAAPAAPSHTLSVPAPSFQGKLTPAKRAALAAAALKAEEEAKQRAAEVKARPPSPAVPRPPPAAAHRPAAPPAAAAAKPPPKPAPKPTAAAAASKPATKPPAGDQQDKPRPRCKFGATCYRANPVHKVEESHPGDSDWARGGGGGGGKKDRGEDDDAMDVDDEGDDGGYRPSASNIVVGRRSRKKVSYKEEPEDSDEEAAFEEPENSIDRAFIDGDSEPEVFDSEDEWGEEAGTSKKQKAKKPTAKKPAKAAAGGKRKRDHDDDGESDDYEAVGQFDSGDSSDEEMDVDESELPKCPYGVACTRKNPTHFGEMRHPHVDMKGKPKTKPGEPSQQHEPKRQKVEPPSQPKLEKKPSPRPASHSPSPSPPVLPIAAPPAAAAAAAGGAALCSIFSGLECVLYGSLDADTRKLITRFFRAFDGDVAESVTNATTHVIADCPVDDRLKAIARDYNSAMVVTSQWAVDCIKRKELVPERAYLRPELA